MSTHPHFSREALTQLLARAREQGRDSGVVERLEWIEYFLNHGSSLQETSEHFHIAPATLRRWMKRFDPLDLSTLEERSHTPHNTRTSQASPEVIEWIREYRMASPLIGKERITQCLLQDHVVEISPSSVARIIEREKLYFASTPLHWRKRFGTSSVSAASNLELPQEMLTVVTQTPSLEAQQLEPVVLEQALCTCFFCKCLQWNWSRIKTSITWTLIAANIVFMGVVFGTVWQEQAKANVTHSTTHEDIRLDGYLQDSSASSHP